MKLELETETVVTIKLNLREARLLKAMMQNPPCAPEDEDKEAAALREMLFNALNEARPFR